MELFGRSNYIFLGKTFRVIAAGYHNVCQVLGGLIVSGAAKSYIGTVEGCSSEIQGPSVATIQDRALSHGQKVQLYLLEEGDLLNNPRTFYLLIDTIRYQYHSAQKAFNILFKTFHGVNANYPLQSEYLWMLIQKGKFPDMFYMDDYYECSKNIENSYCTANMYLIPDDVESELWKEIEDWSVSRLHFNRTVIHRTRCVPSKYQDYFEKKDFFENATNQELKMYNLRATMYSLDCKEEYPNGTGATNILFGLALYAAFILLATVFNEICDGSIKQSSIGKWLICFSLISNWKKLTNDRNPDFQRLKCVQGIRTYQTILVTMCHIMMAQGQLYLQNPSLIEKIVSISILRKFLLLFMFMIQTYFVISSWLLTNQVLEMYKKNGRFSLRDGLVLFIHRVSRFWIPLLVMIFIDLNLYLTFGHGPGNFEIANILSRSCQKNWQATFFQATNLMDINEICNLGMWSLSLDTQFYFITIVFLYLALNYRLDIKKGLAAMFIVTYMVNLSRFYKYEFPILAWVDLKILKRIDFYGYSAFSATYYDFWVNASSSVIGILFGYLYFSRKENAKIGTFEMLCGPIFAIIPITAVLVGDLNPEKWATVLFGPLLKPLFGFGIACGIYGMSKNAIQGRAKSICENRYAVLLGNFTFAIYIHHVFIVFASEAKSTSLLEVTILGSISSVLIDVLQSFAVGIVGAFLIEQPGVNIKNMILPAIRKKEEPLEKQRNGSTLREKTL